MKKSVYFLILLSLFQINELFAQQSYQLLSENSFEEAVLSSGVLKTYKKFTLNEDELKRLKSESPDDIMLSIPTPDNSTFEISLFKKNVLSNGFSVKTPGGVIDNLDLGIHYNGKLGNDPNSLVAFSFYNNCLFGMVATDAGNFNLVFFPDENKNPSKRYVLYNDRDLTIPNTFSCASGELPTIEKKQNNHPNNDKAAGICQVVTQYLECDYRMFLDNGGSIQNTVSWTTGMFNVMSALYSNEQINLQISEIFVWDNDDNYPSATSFEALHAFGEARQDNFNGDLAHLLSTKNEGNGGVAWLDVLCQDFWADNAYGRFAYSNIDKTYKNLPLWSWTINVITHETGHNLGSPHTHSCSWELSPGNFGAIDYCYPTEEYDGVQCYNGPVVGITGTIMSYCHLSGNVNFNLGFGPLPGNLIRERVASAPCINNTSGPSKPIITGALQYCTGDNIMLNAAFSDGTLSWVGPNGFSSSSTNISIPNAALTDAGLYKATVAGANCSVSEFVSIQISNRPSTPNILQTGNILRCVPSSPIYNYQWYTADGTPVGTDSSRFVPNVSGQFYIVISNNGCRSEQSNIFDFSYTVSIDENEMPVPLNIWPNPASGEIFISHETFQKQAGLLSIIDLSGRVVYQKNITTENTIKIDISHLSNSVYTIEINSGGRKERAKFIVNN
jgi:hypothetical protein